MVLTPESLEGCVDFDEPPDWRDDLGPPEGTLRLILPELEKAPRPETGREGTG